MSRRRRSRPTSTRRPARDCLAPAAPERAAPNAPAQAAPHAPVGPPAQSSRRRRPAPPRPTRRRWPMPAGRARSLRATRPRAGRRIGARQRRRTGPPDGPERPWWPARIGAQHRPSGRDRTARSQRPARPRTDSPARTASPATNGQPGQNGAERGSPCTAPQLRRFIKSRPYVPMHELRRRFAIDGGDDDVSSIQLDPGCIYRRPAGSRGPAPRRAAAGRRDRLRALARPPDADRRRRVPDAPGASALVGRRSPARRHSRDGDPFAASSALALERGLARPSASPP